MDTTNGFTRVLVESLAVSSYLADVVNAADSDRDALGFFSRSVYSEFCRKGQLFVATTPTSQGEMYAGHLLFDLRFPKAHVRQIYIDRSFRGRGIGSSLLKALKEQLTSLQYLSIHARVAEDLKEANEFWEAQGFYAQRVTPGGTIRNRLIVVRAHELNTPQLFASSGISAADPLGLDVVTGAGKPLYLLDLNVLFDLGPRRPRHTLALDVFRAERMQSCSLAISTEIEAELKRTAHTGKTDPMLSLAATLARFPAPPENEWSRLFPELAALIFPERHSLGTLTANDYSDLKHLATAIHHRLPGLITSDGRILDQSASLKKRFGVDAISPELFQVGADHLSISATHEAHSDDIISIEPAKPSDTSSIQDLLRSLGVDAASQVAKWAATDVGSGACSRLVARCNGALVGYLIWPASIRGTEISACVAVAEDRQGSRDAVQSMLRHLVDLIKPGEICRIRLTCPFQQATLREIAGLFGYTQSPARPNELQKIVVKRRLNERDWTEGRNLLAAASDLVLPEYPPAFRHVEQLIPIVRPDGEKVLVPLFRLETLLAPALLCLPGREGVLVPVQRQYEEHLLAESPQTSFLPQNKAQLTLQRHYLSDVKTLKMFTQGDLMFFYESGRNKGAGSVTALGRVLRAYHRQESALQANDLSPSVLNSDQVSIIGKSKTKTITIFDNVMRLPRPVPLRELQALQCGKPHQLISSQRLSAQQVQAILEKGLR